MVVSFIGGGNRTGPEYSEASLLKMYFRELPQYIIPSSYYQVFMNIALNFQEAKEANQKKESVALAAKTMADIPDDNYSIVRFCFFNFVFLFLSFNEYFIIVIN
jgi:hypothetical protein